MRFLVLYCSLILGSFTSYGQNNDSLWSTVLDQMVITAEINPVETKETVNTVKIIPRKLIEQRGLVNLQELLQTQANIRISQDPILGSSISINGLRGENLKILIDGVPVIGRLNGSIDAGQIPLHSIQKVEIIEGAQSLLYGSEAAAGVINLITKKSQTNTFESTIDGQYENNGFRNLSSRVGFMNKKWLASISGHLQDFIPAIDSALGRDQVWNNKKQKSVRSTLRFQPKNNLDITLNGNLLNENVQNPGALRRPTFKPYAFDDEFITDRYELNLNIQSKLRERDVLQLTLGWNEFHRLKKSVRFDFDDQKKTLIEGMQDTSVARGFLTRFTFASDFKNKLFSYILGLENFYENASGTRLLDTSSLDRKHTNTNDFALFASAKYVIARSLTVQSGARWTHNMRFGSAITPTTWLMWKPNLPFQLRTSWAYGFRSPALKELYFNFVDINHFVIGNAALKPEKSVNFRSEFIVSPFKLKASNLDFTTTIFYNNVSDRIILKALGPVHYEYANVKNWITKGLSLRIAYNLGEKISFQSDLVYNGFIDEENSLENENQFIWSTDFANDVNVQLIKNRLFFNVSHKLTGRTPFYFNDNGETKQGFTDTWQMLNMGTTFFMADKKIRLNVGVKNILDVRQLQTNNANGIHIEASNQQNLHWGRTMYVGVSYQFQN